MRGFFCVLFSGILWMESILYVQNTAEQPVELQLYAQSAVLLDADSGRILYGKNETTPMAMASTTKIMTCILVLENASTEEKVPVSSYAAGMPKVKLYVKKGEQYTVKELLYSLMLESHNDAAAALAEYIGSKMLEEQKEIAEHTPEESRNAIHRFAEAMNEKAGEIGCEDTWFITPNGLDATETITFSDGNVMEKQHHTTACDLAKILRYCIRISAKKELFLKITGTRDFSFTENGRSYQCHNHNALPEMMEGAFSGKTGFTNKAGYCYVGALERDGKCLIVALLACGWPNHRTYKWKDSRILLEYGLEQYTYRRFEEEQFDEKEQLLSPIPVTNGQSDKLGAEISLCVVPALEAEGREGIMMRPEESVEILYRREKQLKAPVKEGETVGEICYLVDGEVYRREKLLAGESVEAIDFPWCAIQIRNRFLIEWKN